MSKRIFRHGLLMFLVILSFFASYYLWVSDGRTEQEQTNTQNQTSVSQAERGFHEVYAPIQTIHHSDMGSYEHDSEKINQALLRIMDDFTIESLTPANALNQSNYHQLMTYSVNDWLELVFSDRLPIGIYNDHFDESWNFDEMDGLEDSEDIAFNHIAINLEDPSQSLIYDSVDEQIYTAQVSNFDLDQVKAYLADESAHSFEVFNSQLTNQILYLPEDELEVSYRDYVLDRLPNSMYITEFFSDTSNVEVRSEGNQTRYFNLSTDVRINDQQFTLSYANQRGQGDAIDVVSRFNQSYHHVNRLENWPDSVRYYEYDPNSGRVSFQRYNDDLPIFDNNQLETVVEVIVNSDGLSQLKLPLRVIQTPLTLTENDEKTLPSGRRVVEALQDIPDFDMNEVLDLRIGLSWQRVEESDQVIHLEPGWFIRVGQAWQPLGEFIENRGGDADGL